jgi:transposase-like protein
MSVGSYPFPMYSGLLEPEHYKKIGSAIWLFLWCVSSTTSEKEREGTVWGIVLGNKPIRMDDLAEQFDVSNRTIRDWIKKLEEHGYIRVTRAPYGLIFTVRNSKKYPNRPEEKFQSDDLDRKKSADLDSRDRKKSSDLPEEKFRSNKDITKILIDRWINGLDEVDAKELSSRAGVLSTAVGSVSTGQIAFDRPTIEMRVFDTENYFLKAREL